MLRVSIPKDSCQSHSLSQLRMRTAEGDTIEDRWPLTTNVLDLPGTGRPKQIKSKNWSTRATKSIDWMSQTGPVALFPVIQFWICHVSHLFPVFLYVSHSFPLPFYCLKGWDLLATTSAFHPSCCMKRCFVVCNRLTKRLLANMFLAFL